jgi:hypothetical protein
VSDARYLSDMTVEDWRQRVSNLRSLLLEAERQLERAERERISNSPLVQAVLEANRRPVS